MNKLKKTTKKIEKKAVNIHLYMSDYIELNNYATDIGMSMATLIRRLLHLKIEDIKKDKESEIKKIFNEL